MIWVASIRWVIERGCLAALLMKMLFGEQRGMPVSRPFLAVLASCTWLLALGTRHRTRSGPKTVASTAKSQRQLQTTEEAAVLNKNHADVGCLLVCVCVFVCLWLCTENQGTQMKIYVSCAYLCRNVCPGCCHNFFPPPPSLRALFHAFHLTFFVVFFPFFSHSPLLFWFR